MRITRARAPATLRFHGAVRAGDAPQLLVATALLAVLGMLLRVAGFYRGPRRDLWNAESMKLSVTPTANKSEVRRD